MRCLILGATGQIGANLFSHCEDRGLARLGTWYSFPQADRVPLDVRDADAVDELIADYQPDVTFLAAGIACTGYAEAFPEVCRDLTIGGTQVVANSIARRGGKLVIFSSDEVFGDGPTAWREEDPVKPHGVLAQTHVDAERIVRLLLPDRSLIVRTSWVFGPEERNRNIACRLAKKFTSGISVAASSDSYFQPTYGPDLAASVLDLVHRGFTGTIHVVGPDRHTEFTFACLTAHIFGFDVDLVEKRTERDLVGDPPPRGRITLDRHRLRMTLGSRAIRSTSEGLRALRSIQYPKASYLRAA